MKITQFIKIAAALVAAVSIAACSSTSVGKRFNGVESTSGRPAQFQNTTNYAVHLFCGVAPLIGDATVDGAMADFTADARKAGGSRMEITNVSALNLCLILPPFSLILTPTITDIYGFVYR
jgi:hypothetical protein